MQQKNGLMAVDGLVNWISAEGVVFSRLQIALCIQRCKTRDLAG